MDPMTIAALAGGLGESMAAQFSFAGRLLGLNSKDARERMVYDSQGRFIQLYDPSPSRNYTGVIIVAVMSLVLVGLVFVMVRKPK